MTGVLLLNLGGPDSLAAVRPFLKNLFSDRDIIRLGPAFLQKPLASLISSLRASKTKDAYRLIGGKSPLLDITNAQAQALENALALSLGADRKDARPCRVYVGMRYWHPLIEKALGFMRRDGVAKAIVLSMYPHYSIATTGSSVAEFKKAVKGYQLEYDCVESWFDHPQYIGALVTRIIQGMEHFEEAPEILFSAHSLPQSFIDRGDPYVDEIKGTIGEITKRISLSWHLSYQSKTGPVKWLEPTTEEMLKELSRKGVRNLLVVPISFVSDHIETLYEIDLLYRPMAQGLGIRMERIESLNTLPAFIDALADIVIKRLEYMKWL